MPILSNLLRIPSRMQSLLHEYTHDLGLQFQLDFQGVTILVDRGGTLLDPQTALVVHPGQNRPAPMETGSGGENASTIVYVIGLPALNIQEGDRVYVDSADNPMSYRVTFVDRTVQGQTTATAEASE